ncbi:GvpL/GvpF family gas vesicle protein [Neobacillus vireti]|uniref:GvpL/GvpF family gas vesicle protein n=1 Tax=Neobacillus vireti TaxID=220686 RepID=UPI002FFFC12F
MAHTSIVLELLYLYGIIPVEELQEKDVPSLIGIDQKETSIITFKELAAVITPVNSLTYSQQEIDIQLKDAEWLKQKAFHHHECISVLHDQYTILPMSFCTIFQNENTLKHLLNEKYEEILGKLSTFKNKQEWNLKIYCDSEKSFTYVVNHNPAVTQLRESLAAMPKGKQFIMKKKLNQLITSELEKEHIQWWHEMIKVLEPYFSESKLRKNWGKEMSERNDEMIINCDFLIEKSKVELFLKEIQEIERRYQITGCTFQVTGPWPPYHFSKKEKES